MDSDSERRFKTKRKSYTKNAEKICFPLEFPFERHANKNVFNKKHQS